MTEREYFDTTVKKVLTQIDCTMDISITMLDHDTLDGKHKRASGICYKYENGEYAITIDEFFVTECYEYFVMNKRFSTWELVGETLEQVICHELAHIHIWRHGKKHTEFMYKLLSHVTLPERWYQFRDDQIIRQIQEG